MKTYDELYISVDIEATGPGPGRYSMSSLGAYLAGARCSDGSYESFSHEDEANLFYAELKPISPHYLPAAIKVGALEGFDESQEDPEGALRFAWMQKHGQEPAQAMANFAAWVTKVSRDKGARPLFTAYPAAFDWSFVYYYFVNFSVDSPFGFSGVKDLKESYAAKANVAFKRAGKRFMPKHLHSSPVKHDHHALHDAIEQGYLAMNLFRWDGNR